jgi:hypothetical protein
MHKGRHSDRHASVLLQQGSSTGNWTHDQLKLAFYLYFQTPFRNEPVLEVEWQNDLSKTREPDDRYRYDADIILHHRSAKKDIEQIEDRLSEARYNLPSALRELKRKNCDSHEAFLGAGQTAL